MRDMVFMLCGIFAYATALCAVPFALLCLLDELRRAFPHKKKDR